MAIRKNEKTFLKNFSRRNRALLDFDFHGVGVDVALFDGNAYVVTPAGFAIRGVFELDGKFGEHLSLSNIQDNIFKKNQLKEIQYV